MSGGRGQEKVLKAEGSRYEDTSTVQLGTGGVIESGSIEDKAI